MVAGEGSGSAQSGRYDASLPMNSSSEAKTEALVNFSINKSINTNVNFMTFGTSQKFRQANLNTEGLHIQRELCLCDICTAKTELKKEGQVKGNMLVTQLCPTLCDPRDCCPPGSSVLGILQARILDKVAIPSSRDLPDPGITPGPPALQVKGLL